MRACPAHPHEYSAEVLTKSRESRCFNRHRRIRVAPILSVLTTLPGLLTAHVTARLMAGLTDETEAVQRSNDLDPPLHDRSGTARDCHGSGRYQVTAFDVGAAFTDPTTLSLGFLIDRQTNSGTPLS
jgi:hypothetical protein